MSNIQYYKANLEFCKEKMKREDMSSEEKWFHGFTAERIAELEHLIETETEVIL